MEPVEYWDSLFLDTCDIGRGIVDRREGGDVMRGGSEGWFGFAEGECDNTTAGGDVAGDEPEDTMEAMERKKRRDFVVLQCAYPGTDIQKDRRMFVRMCAYATRIKVRYRGTPGQRVWEPPHSLVLQAVSTDVDDDQLLYR
ncbi:hypothetical protein CHU98_g4311 [Xylaria longipes]|nr:hypothetical protein CHU98_g4311 [Xylaria longipes]